MSSSVVTTINEFAGAMRATRRLILLLTLALAAAYWAYSAVVNAIYYTEVEARVEQVAVLCRPKGTPLEAAVDCTRPGSAPAGKVTRTTVAYVRYKSPADGREHRGRVVATGTNQAKRVRTLRSGESLAILAHDDQPDTIKIN